MKMMVPPSLMVLLVTLAVSTGTFASEATTVQPTEIDDPLVNPYCGWGLWAGPRYFDGRPFTREYNTRGFGDDAPLFNWVLMDWMWADLEPQEGRYDWDELDALIDYWAKRGKQVYLRVWVTDDPGWNGASGSEACPAWLWEAGVRFHEYRGEAKSKKREPDYVDPSFAKAYLPKVKALLAALAKRYERPGTPLCMWGVMGYGQWGEWHAMWSHYRWPSVDVKHQVLTQIVNMYADTFTVLPCISYCFDSDRNEVKSLDDFLHRQALDVALAKGLALARHGFIDGLGAWDTAVMRKYWQKAVMLAEGNWSYADLKNHGTHGTFAENLKVMLDWHSTYAHFYMDAEGYRRAVKEDRAILEQGLRAGGLGYRLVPVSLSWETTRAPGELLTLRQEWVNRNVSWCPQTFRLKAYLLEPDGREAFAAVDRRFDPRSWVQGKTYSVVSSINLPTSLPAGVYQLCIALVDESGTPRVRLGIQGADVQLRYHLGTLKIAP